MITETAFPCAALAMDRPFSLSLPDGSPPPGGWPLVMLLHGLGRDHRTVLSYPATKALVERAPFAIVFPNGGTDWYIDSPAAPAKRNQSALLELLDHIQTAHPVRRDASGTALVGWSMGGFGALRLAQDHPQRFGSVATAIAIADFPGPRTPPEAAFYSAALFGPLDAAIQCFNPTENAHRLRGKDVCLVAATDAYDYAMNQSLHRQLETLGIAHAYHEIPGGHVWDSVERAMPIMLDHATGFFSRMMRS